MRTRPQLSPSTTLPTTMPDEPKKIGGDYGEVRANIDVAALNAYRARNAPRIKAPVDVKQFKVGASVRCSVQVN